MIQTYNIRYIFENTNKILLELYNLANLKSICCSCCQILNSAVEGRDQDTVLISNAYR